MAIGDPLGIDIAIGTTDGDTLPDWAAGYEEREITFDTPVALTSGQKYAIVIRALEATDGDSDVVIAMNNTGTYPGGNHVESTNSGISWTASARDFWFKTKASGVVKDSNTQSTPNSDDAAETNWLAQTFTASSSYTLTSVVLKLEAYQWDTTGIVTVSIQDVEGEVSASLVVGGVRDTTGEASVWGLAEDGSVAWKYDTGGHVYAVKRLSSGDYVVGGVAADNGDGGGTRNVWIFNAQGTVQYEAYIGTISTVWDIDFDASYLYICGTGAYRTALDLTGEATITASSTRQAIAVDGSGNIYLGGGGISPTLTKYNSSFVVQWLEDTNDNTLSIDFLSTGELIIGTSDGEVRKYATDGSSPSAGDWAYVMGNEVRAVVDSNNVIYAVRSNNSVGSSERFVALNTSGVRQWGITTASGDLEKITLDDSDVPYVAGDYIRSFNLYRVDTTAQEIYGIMVTPFGSELKAVGIIPTVSTDADMTVDLEAFWTMNDNAANQTVTDESENSRDGTAVKNTSAMSTTGKVNNALDFTAGDSKL
jgi:hypothetical protein